MEPQVQLELQELLVQQVHRAQQVLMAQMVQGPQGPAGADGATGATGATELLVLQAQMGQMERWLMVLFTITTAAAEHVTNSGTSAAAVFNFTIPRAQQAQLGLDAGADGANGGTDIVLDTTPQLGGDLDMNSKFISSGILGIKNTGTQSELRLYCSSNAHYAAIKAPAHSDFSGNITFTLPATDGSANQVLKTDGSGALSWVDETTALSGWRQR